MKGKQPKNRKQNPGKRPHNKLRALGVKIKPVPQDRLPRNIKVNGVVLSVVTISGLARILGRSTITVRKFEARGILPHANFRTEPFKLKNEKQREGERLYSVELANRLKDIFSTVTQGVKVSAEQQQEIFKAFQEELKRLQP